MKKLVTLILCLCLVLSLAACGSAGGGTSQTATTAAPNAPAEEAKDFRVGYHRVDITPSAPTGLAGYGNIDERKHTEVLDFIYLTCVAISDEQDNTVLLYSADLCSMGDTLVASLRTKLTEATGIPGQNIMFNSSHTHSAPYGQGIPTIVTAAALEGAEKALADRKSATMYVGKANTDGINFVRHYYMNDGSVVTDNHGSAAGKTYVGHCTEADEEMRVIQFKRDGGKDVILVNWQSHPHITGGSTKTSLSADIIGAFRTNLEADTGCLFAYYQGGAGNINPNSRMKEENANTNRDWKVHGQLLAQTAKEALGNMSQIQTGPIRVYSEVYSCATNKEDLELAVIASTVRAYYEEGHTIGETQAYAQSVGLQSLYHANSIGSRGGLGDYYDLEISAISFGEFGWAMGPYEMFDASAKFIRENSPFKFTFVTGYTNGGNGYIPTLECWEYGAYEADTSKFARGTAEELADRFLEILNDLHG